MTKTRIKHNFEVIIKLCCKARTVPQRKSAQGRTHTELLQNYRGRECERYRVQTSYRTTVAVHARWKWFKPGRELAGRVCERYRVQTLFQTTMVVYA